METRINLNGLLVDLWLNESETCVVFAPGFPQFIDKYHPMVKIMKDIGVNLFVPRYYGSGGSQGTFALSTCMKSIDQTIRLAKSNHGVSCFDQTSVTWLCKRVIVIGFSFGALPALLSNEAVNKTILVAPFIHWDIHHEFKGEAIPETIDTVLRAHGTLYRVNKNKLISELKHIAYPEKKKSLAVVYGHQDTVVPIEEVKWLVNTYNCSLLELETGHTATIDPQVYKDLIL